MFLRLPNSSSQVLISSSILNIFMLLLFDTSHSFCDWQVAFIVFLLVLTYLLKFRFYFHFPSPIRAACSHFSWKALHSDWNPASAHGLLVYQFFLPTMQSQRRKVRKNKSSLGGFKAQHMHLCSLYSVKISGNWNVDYTRESLKK